ncbi:hypothetical protein [Streptomyces sp. DSM 40750]|uniref:hypothetical protein n=1 Tax=Streptomyces sp. DSM 40750 TaxID=2801030 RepID=UPI00214CFEEE|nr:hypothetical protein [Streptomyces sp. DSM 40750]UUU23721.1 hypothetical protein JIX55_27590 [Streptomyces sp. DSM 40750]
MAEASGVGGGGGGAWQHGRTEAGGRGHAGHRLCGDADPARLQQIGGMRLRA